MEFLGLDLPVTHLPELDKTFVPLARFFRVYESGAKHPFALAVEREDGLVSVYNTALRTEGALSDADRLYVDRLAKFLLWSRGGWKLIACGSGAAAEYLRDAYAAGGSRDFDRDFMEGVYERPFTVESRSYADRPAEKGSSRPVGRHLEGCRIGLDAGASNLKVSALVDGKSVFSDTMPWRPSEQSAPQYHYDHITAALRAAAEHLPQVDGVGVSTAGVLVGERCMVASLFLSVGKEDFDKSIKDIYPRTAASLGENIPFAVANDGDVTALAGAMGLNENGILGISMGSSEAGGYVDKAGNVTGWFNELAFTPIDVQADAARDDWSGDVGCGVKYLSQEGAVKLAAMAGLEMPEGGAADKFSSLRRRMDGGDKSVEVVYRDLGVYLGHALALYTKFYDMNCALVMGGVAGGAGGDIILSTARQVLADEYPDCTFSVQAPDERVRQIGQSAAAASLPDSRA